MSFYSKLQYLLLRKMNCVMTGSCRLCFVLKGFFAVFFVRMFVLFAFFLPFDLFKM